MLPANTEHADNLEVFRLIADGNFNDALHLAEAVSNSNPKNKAAIHTLARLDEIQTTIPYPKDYSTRFPAPENIEAYPAFVVYQAEILAKLGNPRAGLLQLDSLSRKIPRLQGVALQIACIRGMTDPDDVAFYNNLLDVSACVPREDLNKILDNNWMQVQKSPFIMIAEGEKGRIFASCATFLLFAPGAIACWISQLSEYDYLILTDWGTSSDLPSGFWKALVPAHVRSRVYFLSNEIETHETRISAGLKSVLVNNNCWIDEGRFQIAGGVAKKYDAIYTARAIDVKRVHLAEKVSNLALVCSDPMSCAIMVPSTGFERCEPTFKPDRYLNHTEIAELYNESCCGLILSRTEGACYTAVEYMLCGIPVVSTEPEPGHTLGGRQAWLSPDNSIYCEPTAAAVADAVECLISMNMAPADIRDSQVSRMTAYRKHFEEAVLLPLLHEIRHRGDSRQPLTDLIWKEKLGQWRFRMEHAMIPLKDILSVLRSRED